MAHFQQKEAPNHLAAAWNHPLGPPKLKARCRQICKPAPSGPSNSCLQYPNSTARWSPQMSSRPVPVGPQKSSLMRCLIPGASVPLRADYPKNLCFPADYKLQIGLCSMFRARLLNFPGRGQERPPGRPLLPSLAEVQCSRM